METVKNAGNVLLKEIQYNKKSLKSLITNYLLLLSKKRLKSAEFNNFVLIKLIKINNNRQ